MNSQGKDPSLSASSGCDLAALRKAFDLHAAVVIADGEGRVLEVNAIGCEMSKYSREELLGQDYSIIRSERHSERFMKNLLHTILRGGVWRGEICNRAKDGDFFWTNTTITPFLGEDGKPMRFVAIANEITAHKKASQYLQMLWLSVEESPVSVLITNKEGYVEYVNPKFTELTGYTWGEIVGKNPRILKSGLTPPIVYEEMWGALCAGENWHGELCNRKKDGSLFWETAAMSPVKDEQGNIIKYLALKENITERKEVEQALRESEARFRKLFEDSAEAILILENDVFVDCNRAALAMLRVSDPEYVRHIPPQSLSPEFQPDGRRSADKAAELIARAFECGSNLFEWVHLRADGEPFVAEVLLTPILDRQRQRLHVVWRDITQRKQAEQLQLKLLGELERSNRELEQFAYIASHDLQEPLRMVASYTQLLAEKYQGKLDEKADKYIHYAVDGAKRMQGLIHDLLSYASVHPTTQPPVPIDCSELVRDALQNLSTAIESSHTTVQVGELPTIHAERILMLQVFQNLIGNAVKFSDKNNPHVEISSRKEGEEWIFEVRDNGIGIDPQFHDRIFGIFQRLHNREKYQGTGIGLAVVKKIIEQYKGRIWVESSLGSGARFLFSLPEKMDADL